MRLLIDLAPSDPRRGLAIDEALFEAACRGASDAMRLWVNGRSVIVGRSQAAEDEVDIAFAEREQISILRRISGGGTVYHYPGNLNLSVVLRDARSVGSVAEAFRVFGETITRALSGIHQEISFADNDLLVGSAKVGGAAQARRGGALLYHTTLLVRPVDLPMDRILLALRPGYRAARVASRPRETISLSEAAGRVLAIAAAAEPLVPAIAKQLSVPLVPEHLSPEEAKRVDRLTATKYNDPTWNRSGRATKT
jgi:lipoate-protein ligase A